MQLMEWTMTEIDYCVDLIPHWRTKTFREQEALIYELKSSGKVRHRDEEIRLRFNFLDKVTGGECSSYELLAIPHQYKQFVGICRK